MTKGKSICSGIVNIPIFAQATTLSKYRNANFKRDTARHGQNMTDL